MCITIWIGDDEIESVGRLKEVIGAENVVVAQDNDEACLCGCDVIESAKRAGYKATRDEFGFILEK
jgi:hypothetical protein